jgi:hypothetical protein
MQPPREAIRLTLDKLKVNVRNREETKMVAELENMTIDLSKDGAKVVILGGNPRSWESFRKYPQILFWTGDQKEIKKIVQDKELPFGTKLLVISKFISHSEITPVVESARARGINVLFNKNDGEVARILDELTHDIKLETSKKNKPGTKDKLKFLRELIDFNAPVPEEARRLYEICKERDIESSVMSISQILYQERKKRNLSGVPKSLKNKLDLSVEIFDSAIKELASIRDYFIEVVDENRSLKMKLDKFKKAFED